MQKLAVFVLLGLVTLISGQADPNPKCDPNKLSQCTSRLLRGATGEAAVPETVADVEKHCSEVKNAAKCIRGYFQECAPASTKQMARVVMGGIRKRINKNCSPFGIRELLKHTDCMKASRAALKQCYKQGLKDIYVTRMSENRKNWHPLMCCFGSRAHSCAINAVKANCDGANIEYFVKESTQLVDEMMDTFCPQNLAWGKSECAELVSTLPDVSLPTDRNITILPMLMDIVKEFSIDTEEF